MAYDFLNKTTFTDDLAEQQNMINYIASNIHTGDDGHDYDTSEDHYDSDLVEMVAASAAEDDGSEQQPEQEDNSQKYDYDDEGVNDDDVALVNSMFATQSQIEGDDNAPVSTGYMKEVGPRVVYNDQQKLDWLKTKSNNVKLGGLNQNISKYLNSLPENIRNGLVATSGNDQEHTQGSAHYDNRAIDLRYNDRAYNFIKNDPNAQQQGIKMLDPNHGTAPHIHLQTQKYGGQSRYAFGGNTTLFADTEETLRQGLNASGYDKALLKLSGTNTIRGLDNNQPVAVTDGSKYKILKGKNDTSTFKGNVYETKLK